GVPFREAHHISGRAVALAEDKGVGLENLTLEEFQTLSDRIESDVFTALDYDTAVARRNVPGGTGPDSVARQISTLHSWLEDTK
ncbi:MAG: argininosuccinate lyase, partial [Mailhella sp.]